MATPRKALPIAARAAVRDARDAATTAASLIRQVRRAQTRATPGDTQLADALERLGYAQLRLGEALEGGSMADEKKEGKGRPVPSVGRVVHFVSSSGACRPALIMDLREHTGDDTIDLYVMQYSAEGGAGQQLQVKHDEDYKDHLTWHWPEKEHL